MDLGNYRKQYQLDSLRRSNLNQDPMIQFDLWFKAVIEASVPDPNAMVLATVNANGAPSQRIVLLKHYDDSSFTFYTNTQSQKAADITVNPMVSLHFPWHFMERQVEVLGLAEPLSRKEVETYFLSRPRDSQVGAWASHQSQPIASRAALVEQFERKKREFEEQDIPLPDFWGGYRVIPTVIEFWQGGEHRLHDRFEFTQNDGQWQIQRLSP